MKPADSFVEYKKVGLVNVSEYQFLGINIKSNGDLSHSSDELVKKARKALFSLKSYTGSLNNLPVNVACSLFDKW